MTNLGEEVLVSGDMGPVPCSVAGRVETALSFTGGGLIPPWLNMLTSPFNRRREEPLGAPYIKRKEQRRDNARESEKDIATMIYLRRESANRNCRRPEFGFGSLIFIRKPALLRMRLQPVFNLIRGRNEHMLHLWLHTGRIS